MQNRHNRGPLILLHVTAMGLLVLSLVTGLRIAADHHAVWFANYLPEGSVHRWHLLAALCWGMIAAGYVVLKKRAAGTPPRAAQTTLNAVLIRLIRWLVIALLVSGSALYLGMAPLSSAALVTVHYVAALALAAVVSCHLLAQWTAGRWPRWRSMLLPSVTLLQRGRGLLVPVLVAAGAALILSMSVPYLLQQELVVARMAPETSIELDGEAREDIWQQAPALTIETRLPDNAGDQVTPVTVRALHNDSTAFFFLRWPDPTRSGMHLPLEKTEAGWRVLHTGFATADESVYYEDKLAIMLSPLNAVAGALSAHLGAAPLTGYPGSPHRRGLHASSDDNVIDVWHWKSVRNAGTAQLDDSYFGPPRAPLPMARRYTGGYYADPRDSGGHAENWEWFDAGIVTPKRLPKAPALLEAFASSAATEPHQDGNTWGLYWHDTEPYDPAKDHYPVGTRMPSVLWQASYEGDRGDVRAQAVWRDGYWQLELARGMAAHSPFDQNIRDGIFLWVAVFDHAQTRHSYHLRPMKLRLQKENG